MRVPQLPKNLLRKRKMVQAPLTQGHQDLQLSKRRRNEFI
jgi:hypothetical protein